MKVLTLNVRYERNLNLIYYVWLFSQRLCDSIGLTVQVLNQFSSWGKITCKHKTQTGVVSFMADLQKLCSFLRCNYFIGTVSSGQYEVQKARYTFFSVKFWHSQQLCAENMIQFSLYHWFKYSPLYILHLENEMAVLKGTKKEEKKFFTLKHTFVPLQNIWPLKCNRN